MEESSGNVPSKQYGKNREKLLQIELKSQLREYDRKKNLTGNTNNKENVTALNVQTFYNKEANVKTNKMTDIILKNPLMNMVSKNKYLNWLSIPLQYNQLNYYSKLWKFYDMSITTCNLLVMLLVIYDYELNFTYPRKIINEYNFVRVLVIILSILSIFCVIKRHYHKQKWRSIKLISGEETKNFLKFSGKVTDDVLYRGKPKTKRQSFFRKGMVIDIIINLIIPYPLLDFKKTSLELDRDTNSYIEIEYLFSDFLYVLIILRTIYILRSSINYSIFTDHYAHSIARDYGVKCNTRFALKCIIKTEHFNVVFIFLCASILILGFALRVFERPYWEAKGRLEFDYLSNSMHLIFITMITVGYGDYAPMTSAGKYVCVIAGLWGTFICSLVVVCLYGLLDLSTDQFEVFVRIVKSRTAISLIENAYVFKRAKTLKHNKEEIEECYIDMISSFNEFKGMRTEKKSIYRSNGLLFYNMKLLKEIKKLNQRLDKMEADVEAITTQENFKTK